MSRSDGQQGVMELKDVKARANLPNYVTQGEKCSEEEAAGEAPPQCRQGRVHCGGTDSIEMDSAGQGTGAGGAVGPAVAREMEVLVPAEYGIRGQGRHRVGGTTDGR